MEKRLPRHTVAKKYCVHYLPSTEEKSFCVLYPYRLIEITFKITSAQLSLKHRPMFKASSISDSQYFQYFHLYQSPFSPRFTFYSAPSLSLRLRTSNKYWKREQASHGWVVTQFGGLLQTRVPLTNAIKNDFKICF